MHQLSMWTYIGLAELVCGLFVQYTRKHALRVKVRISYFFLYLDTINSFSIALKRLSDQAFPK